ncbi:hypothetical protein [Pseudalkalibacillus caeni]|uniref:DUF4083 domain-containing protein n=1 Tax=Exobacillus caeni TaxID=2574798 RepID=A0A5R9F6D0_9BACL|nr:hypothetical protein [Pseudalkalibacillus caeni]TLS37188.1 hypothetical protein FCL54_11720 [Pseudalkalibacillus caeni]
MLYASINTGDIIFQLISFVTLISIAVVVIWIFVKNARNKSRLARIEEKLDRVITDKDHK